jgi:hypothetical protein
MANESALYQVVDYILNQASTAELEVIIEALKRRQTQATQGFGGLNLRGMAENMARSVNEQLGASLDVGEISRKIVADIIREKEPQITEDELQVLLDRWLPSSPAPTSSQAPEVSPQERSEPESVPPDVLLTMIGQFLQARQGKLSAEELDQLPKDWQARYWKLFPAKSQQLIQNHLDGRIDEVSFWEQIIGALD